MYAKYVKRVIDFVLSLAALIVLSPVLIILIICGAVFMGGNPFFTQERPGRIDRKTGKERIFRLIKFRTMDSRRDKNGDLLPDDVRLNKYGRILRSTSLDELPELFNILLGDMSIVGPRPLLVEYLPYYTEEEHERHSVRPGLTGLAQVNGRNAIASWEERFDYDLQYVRNCTFRMDVSVIFKTIGKVLKRSDILVGSEIKAGRLDDVRAAQINTKGTADESNYQKV